MRSVYFIFFALLVIVTSCDIFNPPVQDYSNKILFTSTRSGSDQLYIMDPDGTNIEQITDDEYAHSHGRWSPDASKIACRTDENSCTIGQPMLVIDLNNKQETLLYYGGMFEWHPYENKLIYDFLPFGEMGALTTNIYTEIIRGTLIENDMYSNRKDMTPSYSPDGSLIAFSSNRDFYTTEISARSELYLMNSDATNQHRITFLETTNTLNPIWSSDQSKLFFNSEGNICRYDFADSTVSTICDTNEFAYVNPRLSPNNDKIIFIARTYDGSANTYLFISDIDGSNIHALIEDSTVTSCDWSKQ